MATESPKERSDEATLTSNAELVRLDPRHSTRSACCSFALTAGAPRSQTTKIDADSQNADLSKPQVNGEAPASAADEFENKHISDIVDDLVNSTEVSVSGGSDNEAAKSDASKTKDPKSHVSLGVKKPASFKAVNVNKTFLTAKSPAPGAQSKASEKSPSLAAATPSPTGVATISRPRLVAKTASGLISKGSGANGAKQAPDASAVWNKNRREQTSPADPSL
jgi:hypothetical protein